VSDAAAGWRPPPRPTPYGALVVLVLAGIASFFKMLVRRLTSGPTRASWSFATETFAAVQRGTWSAVPRVGSVAFRDAAEALIPSKPGQALRSQGVVGGIAGDWFTPHEPCGPVLLYLHGGGYVMGSASTHLALLDGIAIRTSWRVFAPDYRLAPEHPRPAAEEDALATYRGLLAEGISPSQIVVAGDSAGGNLTNVLLLRLRDAGEPLPAGAVLICPWADLSCSGDSFRTNADADYIVLETAQLAAADYLAGHDPADPAVSPLYADLSGLPPLLIQGGSAETLRDQILQLAARAEQHGTETRLSIYEDMVHDWHMYGIEPHSGDALDEIAEFARSVVG